MPSWDDVFALSPDVVTRESGDELVVVLPDQGKYFVVNATGMRMMELADGTRTLRQIADMIADEFDADVERVRADVISFTASLIARKALVLVD